MLKLKEVLANFAFCVQSLSHAKMQSTRRKNPNLYNNLNGDCFYVAMMVKQSCLLISKLPAIREGFSILQNPVHADSCNDVIPITILAGHCDLKQFFQDLKKWKHG